MNKRNLLLTSSLWLLFLVLNVNAVSAQALVRPGFRFTDDFEDTTVSGIAGTAVTTPTYGSTYAVYGLEWTERRDRPCSLTARLEHISDSTQAYSNQEVHRCGDRGPKEASRKEMAGRCFFYKLDRGLPEPCRNPGQGIQDGRSAL